MNSIENTRYPDSSLSPKFLLLLGCYFALHIILRVTISDSLDYDEAEQALLGQWLLAGYTEQPPLYTWLQYLLFEIFGRNVFAISLLKNCLLFLTYLFVFLSSKVVLKDVRKAVLATSSLLFIPQIAWESQRDMTHTTLVVLAAAATLYLVLRLANKQSTFGYLLLGISIGVGIMAKANFLLFTAVILCALITLPAGRRILCNHNGLVTLIIIGLITGYYLLWMLNNQDIVFSATHKFKRAIDNYYTTGTLSLFTNSFLFLTPFWLIALLLFPAGYGLTDNFYPSFEEKFITRYLLFVFCLLFVVVLTFKVTYVKDRWLQPLLFATPIFFFTRVPTAKITTKRFKIFLTIAVIAALGVYTAFTIRVAGASFIKRFCRMNYPFASMVNEVENRGFKQGLIISNNRFLAGNMVFKFPDSIAIIPDYNFETLPEALKQESILVIWQAERSRELPKELGEFLKKTYNVDTTKYPITYLEKPYKYGRGETVTMAVMVIEKAASG